VGTRLFTDVTDYAMLAYCLLEADSERCSATLLESVDKKAQLSLGKTRYSLYSSCCSTDLQGHPRSMIFISSEKVYATLYK